MSKEFKTIKEQIEILNKMVFPENYTELINM